MTYNFAAIVDSPPTDQILLPQVDPATGSVNWEPLDGQVATFAARGLTVYRGSVDRSQRIFAVQKVDLAVHVSQARVVVVCRRFDKGGGWIGTPGAMVVLNAASMAMAAARNKGKILIGQVRYGWLVNIGLRLGTSYKPDLVRLVAQDYDGVTVVADVELGRGRPGRPLAQVVLDHAAVYRLHFDGHRLNDPDRHLLASGLHFPEQTSPNTVPNVSLPGAMRVSAATAYPSPPAS